MRGNTMTNINAIIDDESIEDKYKAIEDANDMMHNMHLYGTIDAPYSLHERAVARYVHNAVDNSQDIDENTLKFFHQMAGCVVKGAETLIANNEIITDEKIAELCQETWYEFNQD